MIRWLRSRGRRGWFLASHGLLFAGYGLALDITVDGSRRLDTYSIVTNLLPLQTWAYVWGVVGALSILAGMARRFTSVAFAAQMGVTIIWTANFLLVETVTDAPGRTWVGGLLFASLTASIAIVAGWRER